MLINIKYVYLIHIYLHFAVKDLNMGFAIFSEFYYIQVVAENLLYSCHVNAASAVKNWISNRSRPGSHIVLLIRGNRVRLGFTSYLAL